MDGYPFMYGAEPMNGLILLFSLVSLGFDGVKGTLSRLRPIYLPFLSHPSNQ